MRLASVNCSGSGWSQTFNYDAYGNLTTGGNGQFQPGYNSTNQMMGPATYDMDGNSTNDEEHTYAWDAYGRPSTIDAVSITYDALGRMVEQNNGGTYTEVQYSPTGFMMYLLHGMSLVKAWVPMPAGTAEVFTPGAFFYRHSDWLGSSRFASTTSRTMYYDAAYAPFGQPYAENGTTDRNFTGMDQDIVSGLYDFPAREYNALEGRWPSPDPSGLASVNPADPQTWNRYAYVRNSPLTLTDPTGLDGEDGSNPCDGPNPPEYCGTWCGGACGLVGAPEQFPNDPIVRIYAHTTPPPTQGLPPGIFSSGPGVDYSWLGLLEWAGLIHPCQDIGCFQNWHTGPTGLVIGDRIGEQLCNSDGGACQNAWWNGQFWGSQCDLDPDWCITASVFGRAGEVASPKNIFTIYVASVVYGAVDALVPLLVPGAIPALQCASGALIPIPSVTPIGLACSAASQLGGR